MRIQDGYLNKKNIIEESSVNWKPVDPYCPQFQQYEIHENSSIILGDIFVPGQVIVGLEFTKESDEDGKDKLLLSVLSRPLDPLLSENEILYEENYKSELQIQSEIQVIQAIDYDNLTNHRIYQSKFRKNDKTR